MAPPKKHHFLPIFYLKQWAGDTGTIVEFSRPYGNSVKPRRVHPAGTGYINRLYAIDGFPDELAQEIETNFLSPVDSRAAETQQLLLSGQALSCTQRIAWAEFIATLMLRMPDDITNIRESLGQLYSSIIPEFKTIYNFSRPDSDEPFEKIAEKVIESSSQHAMLKLRSIMSNKRIINGILEMKWFVLHLPSYDLITSDRPVIFDTPFKKHQGWLACPISPHHLFIAYQNKEILTFLESIDQKKLRQTINNLLASASKKYAYAENDRHLKFIQKRMNSNTSFDSSKFMREKFNEHIPILKNQIQITSHDVIISQSQPNR